MILRQTQSHIVAITQPAHAWLAGQLAEAWGNTRFEVPQPRDDVVCATHLHDIGWLAWEQSPQLNPKTGYPLEFQDVAAEVHTHLWMRGVEQAAAYGDFVALLVSRHGDAIYEKTFDPATARPSASEAVRAFTSWQHDVQLDKIARIAATPAESWIDAVNLQTIKDFIVAIDTMSLHLCWGIKAPVRIDEIPSTAGLLDAVRLSPLDAGRVEVDPWPFARERISLKIPGRRLDGASCSQDDLVARLRVAVPVSLDIELTPV